LKVAINNKPPLRRFPEDGPEWHPAGIVGHPDNEKGYLVGCLSDGHVDASVSAENIRSISNGKQYLSCVLFPYIVLCA